MSRFGFGFLSSTAGNDQFTKSLLHFDGTNGSTTITDSAVGIGTPLSWTAVGCSLSTAAQKFGSASLLNAGNQRVSTPDNAAFNNLGSTPFVFDCWINTSASGVSSCLAGIGYRGTTYSWTITRDIANTFSFVCNGVTAVTPGTVSAAGWHHIAGIADGSKIYAALDGAVSAGVAYSSLPSTSGGGPFEIGAMHFSSGTLVSAFAGNIDEARLSIGTDRGWTSNFTAPSGPYN